MPKSRPPSVVFRARPGRVLHRPSTVHEDAPRSGPQAVFRSPKGCMYPALICPFCARRSSASLYLPPYSSHGCQASHPYSMRVLPYQYGLPYPIAHTAQRIGLICGPACPFRIRALRTNISVGTPIHPRPLRAGEKTGREFTPALSDIPNKQRASDPRVCRASQ